MGLREVLERVSRMDTGRPRPQAEAPPSGQLVVIPLDPLKIKAQLHGLQNQLVELEGTAGRIEIKAERILEHVEKKLAANAQAQARIKAERRALLEKLVPWCQECGLYAKVPD